MRHLDTSSALLAQQIPQQQQLISELLENFHPIYAFQLNELIRLAERVEMVHGDSPSCPIGLASQLKLMMMQLEAYLLKEQSYLFPALINEQKQQVSEMLPSIQQDQGELTLGFNRIEDLTNGIITPEGACNTWRTLYLSLSTFKSDLFKQFQLENKIFSHRLNGDDASNLKAPKKEKVHGEDFCCGSCGGS